MSTTIASPSTIEETIECVRSLDRVRPVGGGTKAAMSRDATLSMAALGGVLEYDPHEYTITALAGTPLAEINQALDEHGQQLAFDPPFAPRGATLGGAVASGVSGPGRFRSGGVRDFVLGIQAITGGGELFRAGGKVVKNSAGFDLPKLMAGSMGRFALLAEVTLKVLPKPQSSATICFDAGDALWATEILKRAGSSNQDVACIDMDDQHRVYVRTVGYGDSPAHQLDALRTLSDCPSERLDSEGDYWQDVREFTWPPDGNSLVKVSTAPSTVGELIEALSDATWRISCGGHVGWIAWPAVKDQAELDDQLRTLGMSGIAVTGDWASPFLGVRQGEAFERRLQSALDPEGKFELGSGAIN